MALSPGERMKAMRERKKADYTRLDILLLNADAKTLVDRAYKGGVTKAEYVTALLNANEIPLGNIDDKYRAEANLELMTGLHERTLAELRELKLSLELADRELKGRENRIDDLDKSNERIIS